MLSASTDLLLEAVGSIYETVLNPANRASSLNRIAACLDANAVHMFTSVDITGAVVDSAVNNDHFQDANDNYALYYGAIDPRRVEVLRRPEGKLFRCHELFDERYVSRSEFFQDFFLKTGERWLAATHFKIGAGTTSILGVLRENGKAPFEAESGDTISRLIPHFQRANTLRSKLAHRAGTMLNADSLMQALPIGCLLLDGHGRAHGHNPPFQTVIAELQLRFAGSFVHFPHGAIQVRWVKAIDAVTREHIAQSLNFATPGGSQWRMHLVPLKALTEPGSAQEVPLMFALFDKQMQSVDTAISAFSQRFRLTPSESEILKMLRRGLSIKAVSLERQCSISTIRTQLQSIYEKSGMHSQRELMLALYATESPGP